VSTMQDRIASARETAEAVLKVVAERLAEHNPKMAVHGAGMFVGPAVHDEQVYVAYAPANSWTGADDRIAVSWSNGHRARKTAVRLSVNADRVVAKVLEGLTAIRERKASEERARVWHAEQAQKLSEASRSTNVALAAAGLTPGDTRWERMTWKAALQQDGTARYGLRLDNLTDAEAQAVANALVRAREGR